MQMTLDGVNMTLPLCHHMYVQVVVSGIRSVSIIVRSASIIINVHIRIKFDSDKQTYLTIFRSIDHN